MLPVRVPLRLARVHFLEEEAHQLTDDRARTHAVRVASQKHTSLSKGVLISLFHSNDACYPRRHGQVLYLGFNRITDISALCLERMPFLLAVDLQVRVTHQQNQ